MYRKNTGSQTVYATIVNATTGAGETTGVAVTVSQDGAAGSSGAGTLAHISGGMWAYTPSSGEMNCTALGVVFTKSGAVPQSVTIRTSTVNPDDSVRFGLTALPNASAGANGGLPTGDASGRVTVGSIANGAIAAATFAAGAIDNAAIATDAIGSAELAASAVTEIQSGLSTLDAAAVRTAVGLATNNLDTQLSGINSKTTNLPSDPADASDINASFSTVNSTLATIAAYVDTEVAAIKAKTDNLPAAPASVSDIPTTTQIQTAIRQATLTEGYAVDGSDPTLEQMLHMVWSALSQFGISGTTITCKKLDGSTTAMTFTMDDATNPTSRTRTG